MTQFTMVKYSSVKSLALWNILRYSYRCTTESKGISLLTQEQLKDYLQSQGWSLDIVPRRKQGKLYAYAKQRRGDKVISKYLCPVSQIETIDEEAISKKLT